VTKFITVWRQLGTMSQPPFVCIECGSRVSAGAFRAACPDCGGRLSEGVLEPDQPGTDGDW
jgi:hypothetical protein